MGALTDGIPPRRRAADINTYESELPRINMHSRTYSLGRVKDGGPLAGKSYLESRARGVPPSTACRRKPVERVIGPFAVKQERTVPERIEEGNQSKGRDVISRNRLYTRGALADPTR